MRQGFDATVQEIQVKSPFFKRVKEDLETYYADLVSMREKIIRFKTSSMDELLQFNCEINKLLEALLDEQRVVKSIPDWPNNKIEAIRSAVGWNTILVEADNRLTTVKMAGHVDDATNRLDTLFSRVRRHVEDIDRQKEVTRERELIFFFWMSDNSTNGPGRQCPDLI